MRHVAFLVPFRFESSLRFLRAALTLPDVAVSLISQDPLDRFDPDLRHRLTGHARVQEALDPRHLVEAATALSRRHGPVDRLIGILEQAQVPLAEARAALGIPGLSVEAAHNFRDKARMKDVLRQAGLPCARHRLALSRDEVEGFVREVGFPIVMKPQAGAGAKNTFRVDGHEALRQILASLPADPRHPTLLEEFVTGEEHSFDAVTIGGRTVWHSISRYFPAPLEVLRNDWIQWCVLLPRHIDGPEYDAIRAAGPRALEALGMQTGLSHMEWFRRDGGRVAISEVGARPPGAQFTTLLSVAHDADMYRAWIRLMAFDEFDVPQRRWAAGAAYLRGQGHGKVKAIHGLEHAQAEVGNLVVEVKLPERGQSASGTYEGEGYVILRHAETEIVAAALRKLVEIVRVELE